MQHMLKGRGAPWYSEGMAEYIAVHNWTDGKLQMQQVIERRQDAPLWGRVKIVRDDYFAEKALMPEDIMLMEDEAFLKNAAYGWSWALCHFLDHHPDYKTAFAALQANVKDISPAFAAPLLDELEPVWPRLREDWQLFIGEIDYGYDVERAAVVHQPVEPLDDQSHTVDVLADRGWQSSGLYIEAGQAVEITASGQFIVKSGDEEWPSEPGGITISYYRGRPLGELHAAIREDRDSLEMLTPLLAPVEVGTGQVLRSERGGVLFLRINDNPNSLADNQGKATVNIRRAD